MKATRVGFYFSIIGIPTYFEGDFYMNAGGGCSKVNITGGSFLAKPILALRPARRHRLSRQHTRSFVDPIEVHPHVRLGWLLHRQRSSPASGGAGSGGG